MKKFLLLKHWQLFLIVFCISLFPQLLVISSVINFDDTQNFIVIFFVSWIFLIIVFGGWLYSLGINLYKLLPQNVTMNLKLFKIFFYPLFFILFFYPY